MANDPELKLLDEEDEELDELMEKSDELVAATKPKKPAAKAKAAKPDPVNDSAKPDPADDPMVTAIPRKKDENEEIMVPILLPELPGSDSEGVTVDPYEHVTLANERKEDCFKVLRGTWVEVPYRVFEALKQKYPKL